MKTNTIKAFCKKYNLTEEQFYGRTKIGGALYLSSLTSIPEGFNPTVGGALNLSSLTSIPEGFNPTVGGSLYLSSLTSIPEGFNPTVGVSLDLRSSRKYIGSSVNVQLPDVYTWRNREYIKADGIFMKVLSCKGNVYRVCRIAKDEVKYLVTDGNGRWSHGDTLEEARKDLIYKIKNRDTSRYNGLAMDSVLSFEDAVECYRVVTGACAFGTKNFVEDVLASKDRKDSYTIGEMIELTKGQYKAEKFAAFFKK